MRAHLPRPELLRPRLKAFLVHLIISVAIVVVLAGLIVFRWYPGPFFACDGGWRGILILVPVQLVLGPVLTGVVYDPRKVRWKTLMDMGVIALVQAIALAWGVHVVESQRPVAASYFEGAFYPVTAAEVRAQGGDPGRIAGLHEQHPPLVVTRIPAAGEARERMERRADAGHAPHTQPELMTALSDDLHELAYGIALVRELIRVKPAFAKAVDAFYKAHPELTPGRTALVPFYGRYANVVFVLDDRGLLRGVITGAFEGVL